MKELNRLIDSLTERRFYVSDSLINDELVRALNDMQEGDGGEVVQYDTKEKKKVIEVVRPKAGRLLIFISDDLPHEVLKANKPRVSLTGWMRA